MADNNQVYTCPPNVRHFFKDMRAKSKTAGPPWRFFSRCVKCTAILCQIVSEVTVNGEIMPKTTAWIMTSDGKQQVVDSTTKKARPQDAEVPA